MILLPDIAFWIEHLMQAALLGALHFDFNLLRSDLVHIDLLIAVVFLAGSHVD
jgi:hypothetical protein